MAFATSSDWIVWLAFFIGCLLLLLTLTLFAMVFVLRISLVKTQQRQASFIETWAPIWNQCFSDNLPDEIPLLDEKDVNTFLVQWLQYQETYEDSMREVLNLVALKAGIEKHLLAILKHKSVREKILALTAFGFLQDKTHWAMLFQYALSESTFLSMAACRAMLHIDAKQAVPLVINRILKRGDWPQARVVLFLAEAGIDVVSEPLTQTVQSSSSQDVVKLIPYLEITKASLALPALNQVLQTFSTNKNCVLASLKTMAKFIPTEEQKSIRTFLSHRDWEIRAAAIKTLAKTGDSQNEALFIKHLNDDEHYVQFEAAKALFRLPNFTMERCINIQKQLDSKTPNTPGSMILTRLLTENYLKLS